MMLLVQAMKSANSSNPAAFAPGAGRSCVTRCGGTLRFDGKHDLKESTGDYFAPESRWPDAAVEFLMTAGAVII